MNVAIADKPVDQMTDGELLAWMQNKKGGYRLRADTAQIWLAVMRSFDIQGPPMTVRGLFYNCENVYHAVPKTDAGYNQVGRQVLAMRRCGVIPYHFVADSTRWVRRPTTYNGLTAFFEHGQKAYRRSLWETQNAYVEVWCEKDAIAGILVDVTDSWDVPLLVVRGYSSETFAFNAAETIKGQKSPCHIYYFGDWDLHGVAIANDIKSKLEGFGAAFTFERVTVTPEQIADWRLPTRPAKPNDPKTRTWVGGCVEVDAVPANRLRELVEGCITKHVDHSEVTRLRQIEQEERRSLEQYWEFWRHEGIAG